MDYEIKLEPMEEAILMESVSNVKHKRTLKLCLPKLMDNDNYISDQLIRLNDINILNDSNTIPEVRNIRSINYIPVEVADSSYRGNNHNEDEWGHIYLEKGHKILCIIPNGNIKEIKVTDFI